MDNMSEIEKIVEKNQEIKEISSEEEFDTGIIFDDEFESLPEQEKKNIYKKIEDIANKLNIDLERKNYSEHNEE